VKELPHPALKAHMALCLFDISAPFAGRTAPAAVAGAGVKSVIHEIFNTDIYNGKYSRQCDQCAKIHVFFLLRFHHTDSLFNVN